MDGVMAQKTSYGILELRGNKMAAIWPLGLDRADLGGADKIEGKLNHMNTGNPRT